MFLPLRHFHFRSATNIFPSYALTRRFTAASTAARVSTDAITGATPISSVPASPPTVEPKFSRVRVRYAPSPTGSVHLGGLRTALYNYLFSKASKGDFIIRIEDTDQKRLVPGAVDELLSVMKWAGIEPDEGPGTTNQSHGPYIQSERLHLYKPFARQLVRDGFAYPCFCSQDRLLQIRNAAHQKGQSQTFYDRHCAVHSKEKQLELLNEADTAGQSYVIRMKIPGGATTFTDLIRGKLSFPHQAIDDQILIKSDGFPTYHFAVVVDDHLQNISHIIRGDEWLPSTAKHILLYKMLNFPMPKFAHLPLLLKSDGIKLSKRNKDSSVEYYIELGYEPMALLNYITFLGWNPGTAREIYSNYNELINEFTIGRVRKSGSIVDIKKLNWYNNEHIKLLINNNIEKLLNELNPEFIKSYGQKYIQYIERDKNHLKSIILLLKDSIIVRNDFIRESKIIYDRPNYLSNESKVLKNKYFNSLLKKLSSIATKNNTTNNNANEINKNNNNNNNTSTTITTTDNTNTLNVNGIVRLVLEEVESEFSQLSESDWRSHLDQSTVDRLHHSMGAIKTRVNELHPSSALSNSEFFGILRYAITAREFGPSLSQLMATLGKEECLIRIRNARESN